MSEHTQPELSGRQRLADADLAKAIAPQRTFGTHKWDVGGVVVIAGSPMYTGAAQLCSRAAGRAGAGIVHLAAPRQVIATIASAIPEVAHIPLPGTDTLAGVRAALDEIGDHLARARSVVVGPGLGVDEPATTLLAALFGVSGGKRNSPIGIGFAAAQAVKEESEAAESPLFANAEATVVVDADALNWLAGQEEWWKKVPAQRLILTPHPGEMARLLGRETDEVIEDPLATVEEAASTWNQTVIFKYGYSAASNGERTVVAEDAPVSLATAGSGDVFAGMVAAFAAQGLEPFDAAALALHIGPRAARRGEQRFGSFGLIATDLPDAIALELATLTDE
ncbi:MAG TPA: ADP/ATP-dependent (S)-NAD(P)H-hydrate dehydratase [Thermomicrobiales bacterium]|nr:ADP/ATP-dependent (S)-NAD(P)H-hydrate dehydratase [Thermomicrobiales bacterium]